MSDKESIKAKENFLNYQEARKLTSEYLKKLHEIGWEVHIGYGQSGHFFLEQKAK